MSKQKSDLQEVSSLYWKMISGGEDNKKTAQAPKETPKKTDCQATVKTDNSKNLTTSLECVAPSGLGFETYHKYNFETGRNEGGLVIKWTG